MTMRVSTLGILKEQPSPQCDYLASAWAALEVDTSSFLGLVAGCWGAGDVLQGVYPRTWVPTGSPSAHSDP